MAKPKGAPKARRRSRRIGSFFDQETEEKIRRGQRSEDLVDEALRILAAHGEILNYEVTEWGDKYDSLGIDKFVWLETGLIAPLQVKKSKRGRREHLESKKSKLVPFCIVADPSYDTPEEVAGRILEELGLSVKFLEPILTRH